MPGSTPVAGDAHAMQTEDLSHTLDSHSFAADRLDARDADLGEAATRMEWPPQSLLSRLPLQALAEHRPHREASRRMPEAISAH